MNLIIKGSGMDKTTQLIYISEATGYSIVVAYKTMIDNIKSTATKLGCKIPEPVLLSDIVTGKTQYDDILVDEATLDGVLKKGLNNYFNSNVVACTCSPDIDIESYYNNEELPNMNLTVSCD